MPSSLLEWEGKLTSVLFLPRCNLRCRYCHAGDLVLAPEKLDTVPLEDAMAHWRARAGWVDGVAITGGEPTLHGEGLVELIRAVKSLPLEVLVETNGTRPDVVEELIQGGQVDAFSMDVKAALEPEAYAAVTRAEVKIEDLRRSIRLIKESDLDYEFRITLVPDLVGREELQRILPELEGSRRIALQNFRPDDCLDPKLSEVRPFAPEEMDFFQTLASEWTERCVVRGREHALTAG